MSKRLVAAVVVITVLASLASWVLAYRLHSIAELSREVTVSATRAQLLATRLDSLEWRMIAKGEVKADELAAAKRTRAELRAELKAVCPGYDPGCQIPAVMSALDDYVDETDIEFDLIDQARMEEARAHDEDVVDPAFSRLENVLRSSADEHTSKARLYHFWSMWAAIGAAALGAMGFGVLLTLVAISRRNLASDGGSEEAV